MNEFEQHVTDLYSLEKMIDATCSAVETLEVDKALNLLIGLKEMLNYQSDILHSDFTKTWKEFMVPNHNTKSYIAEIGDDYTLTIPDFILKELKWEENDVLDMQVLNDGTITITKVDESYDRYEEPGCGGDILTEKELEILRSKGVAGLTAPWD